MTIEDIAREAGVHPASVSRALRGIGKKVSEETRQKIERIAKELGYRPNALAASLRTKQTNLVGIVVPDLGNPLFGPIVQGLEVALRQHGLMCLVVQTPAARAERREIVAALANRQVSGLLILAAESDDPMLEAAMEFSLPTVLVNRGFGERRFPSVVNDDRESVRLVLEHLSQLGHQRVAHIAGPASSSTGRARRQAFEELLPGFGMTGVVVDAPAFTREAGRDACLDLLGRTREPTAIFCANDLIAMGALDALHKHQLSVPGDMSLVGHNDMPLVDLIAPPLTTVRIATEQMSRQAAQLLLEHLKAPDEAPCTRVLSPRLVVRGSTAAPRAGA
ncbi:LacI family DNA-binding transcriptional regulator [Ramlibacter sp. 2FC]|uniref:LacI family DNA-binding transcriptional regulator n=1 Tax=Ramlibacter sp. 2FC TaxID=2502188 RepID=UPI0010F71B6F|nr:LacI family DNA-binding transcriptional regulator [Ramlibacter sp. 2FC]